MHTIGNRAPGEQPQQENRGAPERNGPATRPELHLELPGRIISPGVAFGYAHLEEPLSSASRRNIPADEVQSELTRLDRAVTRVRQHLEEYLGELAGSDGSDLQNILSVQLLMLEDRSLRASALSKIEGQLSSAERAVEEELGEVAERLRSSRDHYLRARAEDVRGICHLLVKALLLGEAAFGPIDTASKAPVFFSAHLRPTAVLRARRAGAVAFLTSSPAFTSHAAILLRASGIPALGGETISLAPSHEGVPLLVDAVQGVLHIRPSQRVRRGARRLQRRMDGSSPKHFGPPLGARTLDGTQVDLWANIDHPSQSTLCLHNRLRGVGLFRTEFMVLDGGCVPDEDEQHQTYRGVLEKLQGRPLIVRTFDIGGDKITAGLHDCVGENPALGLCGIRRHLLRRPGELRTQIRAILRASEGQAISILLPMVTNAEDVVRARAHIDEVRAELEAEGVPHDPHPRVGAMVEIPSAALNVGELLSRVDFVSIGTNDLLQYLTAADRDNPAVIAYQELGGSGLEPLLELLMGQARELGRERDVFVCGELASDPQGARFLVRLGITSLSVTPGSAAAVREAIETLELAAPPDRGG